jgi:hypothetical protein
MKHHTAVVAEFGRVWEAAKSEMQGTSSRFAALSCAFQRFARREVFATVGFGPTDLLCVNRGRWVSLTMVHDEMHDPKEGPAKTEDRPS